MLGSVGIDNSKREDEGDKKENARSPGRRTARSLSCLTSLEGPHPLATTSPPLGSSSHPKGGEPVLHLRPNQAAWSGADAEY